MPGYDDSLCQAARMCPFSGLPCWKTKAHRTAQGFKNGPLSFPPPVPVLRGGHSAASNVG